MVALRILVPPVRVRILPGQQKTTFFLEGGFFVYTTIYCIYDIYDIYYISLLHTERRKDMETTLKRKNIDLPVDTLKKLSIMAVAQGKSLKAYIEQLLISKANSINIEVSENPSPSGDTWFDNPENMESVKRGINEMKAGKGRTCTTEEIKKLLEL